MVCVMQAVTSMVEVQEFVDAWRPYAARTYDPQADMPSGGPCEVRTDDAWKTATAYMWMEPR